MAFAFRCGYAFTIDSAAAAAAYLFSAMWFRVLTDLQENYGTPLEELLQKLRASKGSPLPRSPVRWLPVRRTAFWKLREQPGALRGLLLCKQQEIHKSLNVLEVFVSAQSQLDTFHWKLTVNAVYRNIG